MEKMTPKVMRRSTKRERVSRVMRAVMIVVCVSVSMFVVGARAGCEYYTNCGACVADTNCGWCGNDPHSQGGYGDVNKGDHVDHLSKDNVLVGGSGKFTVSSGTVTGTNTRFTQQFHGGTTGAKFYIPSVGTAASAAYDVTRVISDTSIKLGSNPTDVGTAESFGIAARLGTGTIKAAATDTSRPNSVTTEKLHITGSSSKFTKELKAGYWIVFYPTNAVNAAASDYRVITAILSDTSLTVDKDVSAYVHGGTAIPQWGYVSCPPRIGKRSVGLGTIETHHDQTGAVNGTAIIAFSRRRPSDTPEASTHHLVDASGSATMYTHRIIGRGTRFETQFGLATTWASKFHGAGPWISAQINGDWETVRVNELGTAGSDDAEAILVLHNSFSEPLLKATHWEWYPLLTKGYGTIRSYGKRVVSNDWDNKEGFRDLDDTAAAVAGSISSQGVYGSTRFLTQLRTGYTITACGQTRMVNSIQSDVELTIDRPFTLGNREFVPQSEIGAITSDESASTTTKTACKTAPGYIITSAEDAADGAITVAAAAAGKKAAGGTALVSANAANKGTATETATNCAAGKYSAAGAASCTNCDIGTYSAAGASSCTACAEGKTNAAGSAFCDKIAAGYYGAAGSNSAHAGTVAACTDTFSDSSTGSRAHTGHAVLTTLHVRGLTRLLPLWPRGVTVQIIGGAGSTTASSGDTFSYTTYWKTFSNVKAANAYSQTWTEITDTGVNTGIGVYIKWESGVSVTAGDEWRLHVADIENCRYHISTEGERYMTDDNANPPVCYNHGKCVPANSNDDRPATALTTTGTLTIDHNAGTLVSSAGGKFLSELSIGDIIRDAANKDGRVTSITNDNTAGFENSDTTSSADTASVHVLKCAAGRFSGTHHETSATIAASEDARAYLPHPLHTFYQTWSKRFCEIDPGCCGFRVSSVVDPEQYAYYYLKPDHAAYNFRIAVHTVNDNLDLYAQVHASTRPTTASSTYTSVRESVPWAIDIDESAMACSGTIDESVLGGKTSSGGTIYGYALGHYIHVADSPDCTNVIVGVYGDNRYPQTVGASEYSARVYMEFNFPNFQCGSSPAGVQYGNSGNKSYTTECTLYNLRFAGDAQVVKNTDSRPAYVVRLTESYAREHGVADATLRARTPWKSSSDFRTSQRVGAVWWHRKVHVWDGFETNFEFKITVPTQCGGADGICDGADGFAFVISNDDRQETVDSVHGNTGWACTADDTTNTAPFASSGKYKLCGGASTTAPTATAPLDGGFVGCPGDGLGYGQSTQVDTAGYGGTATQCANGLKKSLAVEFDTFYNVERRDPKQGKQHWWINATEYVSYNDNHLGVFMTTAPFYVSQPWGSAVETLKADHSDDLEGAHFGSTPSVPTMADGAKHTVKIRYTRGFTTEKAGSGQLQTADVNIGDKRKLVGSSTKFKTELRTGFEFGYDSRVKANVKVKLNRDATSSTRQAPVASSGFPDDGEAVRVVSIVSDTEAHLEETDTAQITGTTARPFWGFYKGVQPAFPIQQTSNIDYNVIKEFPGEIQVFIDDMDRYVFQVAVEDRDMAKILDTDGNAYIGITASTGSKGFAKVGYQASEVHQTMDVMSWNFCHAPGCVPY